MKCCFLRQLHASDSVSGDKTERRVCFGSDLGPVDKTARPG